MPDHDELRGRTAVVTGGGAGIGRAAALALARRGADVAIIDIDPERAAATVAAIEALGRRGMALVTDVMLSDEVRAAIARVDDELGRIDVLVNNAGGVRPKRFIEQNERSWRRHIDMNLVSMLAATAAAAPVMIRESRGGSIVNVASIEAVRAAPMYAVYAACKAAMVSFTRTMALELAEHGIRTNAVTPDWIHTPGTSGLMGGPVNDDALPPLPQELSDRLAAYVPLGREGKADECGEVIAFLCSAGASYVNGAVIAIDGGTGASRGWTRTASGWSLFGADSPD